MLLDVRLTPELEKEGLARDVIRHVQNTRKEAKLEINDRIVVYLDTSDAKLAEAIRTHAEYIASETLVKQWAAGPIDGAMCSVEVKIEGATLKIQLKK
jgi:isoleucyl-tRNA synthetase